LIINIDKDSLFTIFDAEQFDQIGQNVQIMAPSMVDYHLGTLANFSEDDIYINRSNIQQSLSLNDYTLHIDYSDNIYMEYQKRDDYYETSSLW